METHGIYNDGHELSEEQNKQRVIKRGKNSEPSLAENLGEMCDVTYTL
jgi:hypothetical protein